MNHLESHGAVADHDATERAGSQSPRILIALATLAAIALITFFGAWTAVGLTTTAVSVAILWRYHRIAAISVLAAWVAVSLLALTNM
ncbi:MAG: hypothetical protein ABIR57_11015 [Aeromicrobium sp.]